MGLKLRILFPLLLMVLLWLPACSEGPLPTPTSTRTPPAATVTQTAPVGAEVATATMPSAPVVTLPPAPSVTPGQLPAGATEPLLSQRPPTAAENDTLARLLHDLLPVRDDIGLQAAFRGVEPLFPTAALVSEPLPVGSTATFKTLNFATNELVETEAVLLYVSDFAYFWFDLAAGQPAIPATTLTEAGTTFDQMHDVVSLYFGAAAQPGIDGDPRAYILHVTPQNLCFDVSCGIAGYFSSADVVPPTISPNSNGHELFIINQAIFDSASYFSTLAHEYRHLIEDSYDQGDWDWEVEGSAMLAELLWGDQRRPIERANLYLSSPDRSLYSWPDTATAIAYGQGFLLNQFLFAQLGQDGYRAFATNPQHGLAALGALAPVFAPGRTADSFYQDWLVALALHDRPDAPRPYRLNLPGLQPVARQTLRAGDDLSDTVSQYGADYYELAGSGTIELSFSGSTLAPLLPVNAVSGDSFWLSERGNQGDARLTRALDLRSLSAATLAYDVYYDLEAGYDFAYVSVSTDGGAQWQPLAAPAMSTAAAGADPGEAAFAPHFYTGTAEGWLHEQIDLSTYAGQEILLRFQVITDPILTQAGLALDNIAVPELAFLDTAEGVVADWIAEGFMNVTSYAPQRWSVQLITFPAGVPTVTPLDVAEATAGSWTIDLDNSSWSPILIISGMTPQTLQPAHYELAVR